MDNNKSFKSPLSFFEGFFSEGFNKQYDDFLHFDKIIKDSNNDKIAEVIRLYDEEIRKSLSKAKNSTDAAEIMNYYSSNSPSCPNASPDTTKVVDYDHDNDIMTIEECEYQYFPDEDSYCVISKKRYKRSFLEELNALLHSELKKAIEITNDAILQMNMPNTQEIFINKLFMTAAYIINDKITTINNTKYIKPCQQVIISYIQDIEKRYPDYVSREESTYKQFLTPKREKIRSLNMIKKSNQLHFLLGKLKDKEFVERNLDLTTFEMAFDGNILEEPLNIKWIKYHKQYYIGSAARMIQLLEEKKYITPPTDKQLSYIFVKGDGTWINENTAWRTARQNVKRNPNNPILAEIEEIIEELDRKR